MRSQFLTCIAVVTLSLSPRLVSEVRAAAPKGKAATKAATKAAASDKKTPAELHADDKSMKKQMQWEDKVMGPDSTRADLERVARAHALNEKATKDRDAQAAREPVAPPVVAKSAPKRAEVALPSVSDGASGKTSNDNVRPREISAKLAGDEAKAPPPAVKPADDKFIDKLLRDEQESTSSRKKSASGSDRDLDRLLAGANEKRGGRRDDVDKLLKNADSGPAMPAPRAASSLPAWTQQPDISPSPAPAVVAHVAPPVAAPVASRQQKKNDGVIRVVQGAASTSVATAEPPTSRAGRPSRTPASRSTVSTNSNWNDPFADSSGSTPPASTVRRAAASRPAAASSEWSDPFADKAEGKPTRRASSSGGAAPSTAPAKRGDKASDPVSHPAGWKDPFTKAPSAAPQPSLAMREPAKVENARWEVASHRAAPKVATAETHQGWGVLKKRAR
jgi:hypothetical protein